MKFCKNKFLCVIHIDFLELVTAKFNLNLEFFHLFISLLCKHKYLYGLHCILKYKIDTEFRTKAQACACKNSTSLE